MNDLSGNIVKLYLFKFVTSFLFFVPVIVLFFQENGLSMTEVMVLQSLYSVSIIILEIPTGYFADYYSRRRALIFSSVFLTSGMSIYSLGTGFGSFYWGSLSGVLVWHCFMVQIPQCFMIHFLN